MTVFKLSNHLYNQLSHNLYNHSRVKKTFSRKEKKSLAKKNQLFLINRAFKSFNKSETKP